MKNHYWKSGFVPILAIVIVFAIVAVVGAGTYFFASHRGAQVKPKSTSAPAQSAPPPAASANSAAGESSTTQSARPAPPPAASANGATIKPPSTQSLGSAPTEKPSSSTSVNSVSTPTASSSNGQTLAQSWTPGTQWVNINSINGKEIKAAVTWPQGKGPFPVVILLHGSEGFRQQYVALAQQLSQSQFITVAACWFTGFRAPMAHFSDYIDCPNDPTFTGANTDMLSYLKPAISYARTLPGSNGKIGMIGSSRGATMSLLAASAGDNIQAVVSVSAIYEYPKGGVNDTLPITLAGSLQSPVLILHGTNDTIVNIQEAKDYAAKLKDIGKPFDSYYYSGAPHLLLVTAPYSSDAIGRAASYFDQYLR